MGYLVLIYLIMLVKYLEILVELKNVIKDICKVQCKWVIGIIVGIKIDLFGKNCGIIKVNKIKLIKNYLIIQVDIGELENKKG